MSLAITFIVLNIFNVIIQTIKSIVTVKGGKFIAAITSAVAYGYYTIVTVYTLCELGLGFKTAVVTIVNLFGVFVVKYFEEKWRKDKLWLVKFTAKKEFENDILNSLDEHDIDYDYNTTKKHIKFEAYCNTQKETSVVAKLIKSYNAKYIVIENKATL